jgi:large subunit ribosomal protein L18
MISKKVARRQKLKFRIRKNIQGTASLPRLSVFRSNKEIYAQLIDDKTGVTLAAINSRSKTIASSLTGTKIDKSKQIGLEIAKLALAKGVTACVFDRSGYLYHGRVKSLAEGAREGGLKF